MLLHVLDEPLRVIRHDAQGYSASILRRSLDALILPFAGHHGDLPRGRQIDGKKRSVLEDTRS